MSDGFDYDKVNLHQRGVVDQPHRLANDDPRRRLQSGASGRTRKAILIALVVLLVGVFVALVVTDDADAPAEPAAVATA